MAVDRSDFQTAGASDDLYFDDFWGSMETVVNELAAFYVAKKAHGAAPDDFLNGLYLGDTDGVAEKSWRVFADTDGTIKFDRNTGSESVPVWSTRFTVPANGQGFITNVMVASNAAISITKLSGTTAFRVISTDTLGNLQANAALTPGLGLYADANGLPATTNSTALTSGQLLYGDSNGRPASTGNTLTQYRMLTVDANGRPVNNAALTASKAVGLDANGQLVSSTATKAELDNIAGHSTATTLAAQLAVLTDRSRLRVTMSAQPASGGQTWTNMPATLTFFSGVISVQSVDLTNFTQVRLMVTKLGVSGAASSKIRLLYKTSFDTTVANYSTIGSSEVEVAVNTTNTLLDTGFINLVAGAKAAVFIALAGVSGDGAADPVFGDVIAEFK